MESCDLQLEIVNHLMSQGEKNLTAEVRWLPRMLAPLFGARSRVSDVLAGKREISKAQAKALAEFFEVPADLFI